MANFYIENFGCRAARADGEAIGARLLADGMAESGVADADVVVVNTCSVTAEADRDARAFIRKANRLNPATKLIVTGCYAQQAPEEIAALDGVTAVVGNSHKGLVPEIVGGLLSDQAMSSSELISPAALLGGQTSVQAGRAGIWADDSFAHSEIENAQVLPGMQTRPNLKIQEGCGNRCTFCIIPTTRGGSRSLAAEKIFKQVHGFVAAGGKEMVLSGINLGRWGRDPHGDSGYSSFAGLIRAILQETGLPRLRLSSIEPMDWMDELIGLMREFGRQDGSARLARHAHLPLQSGSDAVLRRMHRRYRPWHYAGKVAQLVAAGGAEMAIGADVMVGFPGETDSEFRETYDFVESLPFTYLHLFPFSARPGTAGWELHRESPVAAAAVKERMAALQSLIAVKTAGFRAGMVGRELPAVTLHSSASLAAVGRSSGLTDNFVAVEIAGLIPANELVRVQITGVNDRGALLGEVRLEVVGSASSCRVEIAVAS